MSKQIFEILTLLRREAWEKRHLCAALFLIISMAFLAVGWNWPKEYTSSSTILVDSQNILQPLMRGTAVPTEVTDRARMAREIIFSRRAMEDVLLNTNQFNKNDSESVKEKIVQSVSKNTDVSNAGRNLIRISFSDTDPERAYKIAKEITDVFINYSISAKQKESQDAYEFINGQVVDYQNKLKAAEQALKEFNSIYADATPGSQDEVGSRIVALRRQMEATKLEIRELEIRRETIRKQLSGEAAITENLTREGQYRDRLADLEEQLGSLRLVYHDSYPDIVAIKSQIATIENALKQEQDMVNQGDQQAIDNISSAATKSLLYQELRSQYSATESQLASLDARLEETREMLVREEERIVRINDVEAQLAELTRDYEVNQELYQSLSRQRENARISMNIDKENQGLTFKVQEPPVEQLTPEGIRFGHFLAAGVLFSFTLPLGLIYGLTLIDQKVRTERVVSENLGLPILGSVYIMDTPKEYNLKTFMRSAMLLVVVLSLCAYAYAVFLKVSA